MAEPPQEPTTANFLIVGAVVVGVLMVIMVIIKLCIRYMSLPCQFCRNKRLDLFRELDPQTRESILTYFREYEHREPDTEGIFVCRDCKTVFDDFSGEKMSREVDLFQARHFCKKCNHVMTNCGVYNKDIRCPNCHTLYKWEVHEMSGFRFLSPPAGTEVLKKVFDEGIA